MTAASLPRTSEEASSGDIVSLAERMGFLQTLRVSFALVVVGAAALAEGVVGGPLDQIILVTASYLAFSAMAEAARRLLGGRGLGIVGLSLLVDGVYLAWIMYLTGGTLSPLRFLFYIHLIAVTLVASYRTGLKLALWYSLLFLSVYYAQASGILEVREGVATALPGQGSLFNQISVLNIAALWFVAVATAVFSSINERELRRRRRDLEILSRMATEFEEVGDATEVAAVLLERLKNDFGVKRGLVLAGRDRRLSLLSYAGPGEPGPVPSGVDPLVEKAWESHDPVLTKQLDEVAAKRLSSLLPFARNVAVVPLFAEGDAIGVLVVEYPGSRIEKRVLSVIAQMAAHASLALGNAWLLEQVQRMAETDSLTGLANRRVFETTLERELSRAMRSGEPLTLAMIDIDRFKKLNDEHGHQAGDDVLRAVAQALEATTRAFDVAARYGGEEFAVILPGCPERESAAVADRFRRVVAEIDAVTAVTVSAGVATYPTNALDAQSLIACADQALYESKKAGRNRVTRSGRRARGRSARKAR